MLRDLSVASVGSSTLQMNFFIGWILKHNLAARELWKAPRLLLMMFIKHTAEKALVWIPLKCAGNCVELLYKCCWTWWRFSSKMGMLCWPSLVKREEEGGRGSNKFLKFLTLPPKAKMSGMTFNWLFVVYFLLHKKLILYMLQHFKSWLNSLGFKW